MELAVHPVQSTAPRDAATGRTGALGISDFERLAPGAYEVRAVRAPTPFAVAEMSADAYREVSVRVSVEDGRIAQVDLVLQPHATFHVTVEGTDATSLGDATSRAVALRHLFSDGTWRYLPHAPDARVLSAPAERPLRVEIAGVPAGRYRVAAAVRDRARRWVDAAARSEEVTKVTVDAARTGLELHLAWTGADAAAAGTAAFNLNSVGRSDGPVAQSGAFGPDGTATVSGLDPGEYLLLVWQSGWCRRLTKDDAPRQRVEMPPPPKASASGGRRVRVDVSRGGAPLRRVLVALVSGDAEAVPGGTWTRFASSPVDFADAPAEAFTVVVYDGVLGVSSEPAFAPVARRVEAGTGDVMVRVDL